MNELDLIRERIQIVDFIQEAVSLKKAGRNFKGLCPFHSERTSSFIVSPERQIWHCFGCNRGGDIFSFIMELERIEFYEALKILADRANVKLETRPAEGSKANLKERLIAMHHLATEYYHYILTKHDIGERALRYLRERGVEGATIEAFELGFAPLAWDNLAKFLSKKGFTEKEFEPSGLFINGRRGWYDRFRGRIIFPIKDTRGTTLAFSGRILDKDVTVQEAKYINSPETPLYIKGNLLYGLHLTKESIRKENQVVIVEGEFDVISSFQAGISNIVAIKGSALTEMQVGLLKRFTERIILAFDQDQAGDAAARRGVEIADRAGLDIRVVFIPLGKDPDEAARANPSEWKEAVKKAVPYYDFIIASAFKRYDSSDSFGKKKVSSDVLPILARIENPIVQAHYLKILAEKLDIPLERIDEAVNKIKVYPGKRTSPIVDTEIQYSHDDLLELHILTLVLQSDNIKHALELVTETVDPSDFVNQAVKRIFILLIEYSDKHDTLTIPEIAARLPKELISIFDQAFLADVSPFSEKEMMHKQLLKTLQDMRRTILRHKIKELTKEIQVAEVNQNEIVLKNLNLQLKEITADLRALT